LLTGGLISSTGNITGGNVTATTGLTAGTLSLSGNTISSTDSIITIDPASAGSTGSVIIQGNLSVTGNVTYINSNNVTTNDLTINMANNAATAAAANGGGIEVGPAGAPYATFTYNSTSNTWVVSNGANVSGAVSASGNITGGNILTAGLLSLGGSSQAASYSASGNITGGNVLTGGLISAASTVTGSQFNGSGAGLTSIPGGNVIGTLTSTVLGNSTVYIGTTGVALNRASGALTLAGVSLSTLTIGTGLSGTSYNGSGAVTIATNQDISTGASPTFAGLTVGTGTITGGNIVNGNGNGVGNIGSSTVYFNTVFAKATSAQYADLAENYQADANYTPGTVLEFGGEQEVTLSTLDSSKRVAGVVSTNPAHLMNSTLDGDHVVALALVGRVPTRVIGPVAKGDLMVSAGNGRARAEANPATGTVIGKALENFDGSEGTIEVVISMQ
jgi:hypothetical protein